MYFKYFLLAGVIFTHTLVSQELIFKQSDLINNRGCASEQPDARWNSWFNEQVEAFKLLQGKNQANYVIPVVVHVIFGATTTPVGTYPNISQNQINSQINVLNADFAGTGLNVNQLAATAFSAIGAANTNISFCLAQLDPQGLPLTEPGIHRISYVANGWTNPTSPNSIAAFMNLMNGTIKPATIWDPSRYLNIWVSDVNVNIGILGYATFPPGTPLSGLSGVGSSINDGVWVWARSFGSTGTLQSPYNKGRTASHEIGHWLGLRHIGGDGNNNPSGDCNATDFCTDTPPQRGGFAGGQFGQNYGAPSYPCHLGVCTSASNGDMFMNFMDYVDDPSCYMFTPDQRLRMQTAMATSPLRISLTASSNSLCNLPPAAPQAAFSVTNESCLDSIVTLQNQTTGTPGPSYLWTILPSQGAQFVPSNTVATPSILPSQPGFYTITLNATNASGSDQTTQTLDIYDCGNFESVNSIEASRVKIVPNPVNDQFVISIESSGACNIEIFNALGQSVFHTCFSIGKLNVNTADWPQGVYVVRFNLGNQILQKTFTVNHP